MLARVLLTAFTNPKGRASGAGIPRLSKKLTHGCLIAQCWRVSYQPQFTITPALLTRVEQIAALRERILAATVEVPWIPALQKDTRTRNTHSSTAIEGNPLTNITATRNIRTVIQGGKVMNTTYDPNFVNPIPRPTAFESR